jgi:hypothetical protein
MSTTVRKLETAAVAAYAAGDAWTTFWEHHGAAVCRAEPHDRHRFARLVRRLLALVTSGDSIGMEPGADQTHVPAEASQSIEWYSESQSRVVEIGDVQVTIRCVGRKGRRARISITAPAGAVFQPLDLNENVRLPNRSI